MTAQAHSAMVLLVGRDLKAQGRVEATCRAAGLEFETTAVSGLATRLERAAPVLLVVDLDQGGVDALEIVGDALAEGQLERDSVVAYFSHVDVGLGEKADEAGIRALPRGRFWRELPDLVTEAANP